MIVIGDFPPNSWLKRIWSLLDDRETTNKSTCGIERLESSSWSSKSHEVGEALAKLNKTPGKKEYWQQNGLRFWKKHRTWSTNMRVEEWNCQPFSCHANTFLNTNLNPWKSVFVHYTSIKSPKHRLDKKWLQWTLLPKRRIFAVGCSFRSIVLNERQLK